MECHQVVCKERKERSDKLYDLACEMLRAILLNGDISEFGEEDCERWRIELSKLKGE